MTSDLTHASSMSAVATGNSCHSSSNATKTLPGFCLISLPALTRQKTRVGSASGRIQFLCGDFFDAVPSGADVYILKRIIHDWSNEQAVKILTKCREAAKRPGRVLIAETIMREGDAPDPMKFIDAIMLVVTGGTERTEEEYVAILTEAGLRLDRVHATSRPISVLEATRI